MKFIVEIRNVDTLEKHSLEIEGHSAQTTHKHIFMNVLENNEEITSIQDETGHIVFETNVGFFPSLIK
jgi:hypothetical protein